MRHVAYLFTFLLLGLTTAACGRERGVQAASESDYQPRSTSRVHTDEMIGINQPIEGELIAINRSTKTMEVRVDNGMVQTFTYDDRTAVSGLETWRHDSRSGNSGSRVRDLIGKEGSEVLIAWVDRQGGKMATSVEVTQISSGKNRRSRR